MRRCQRCQHGQHVAQSASNLIESESTAAGITQRQRDKVTVGVTLLSGSGLNKQALIAAYRYGSAGMRWVGFAAPTTDGNMT